MHCDAAMIKATYMMLCIMIRHAYLRAGEQCSSGESTVTYLQWIDIFTRVKVDAWLDPTLLALDYLNIQRCIEETYSQPYVPDIHCD